MKNLNITGSMTVAGLQNQFKQTFGGTLRVYKVSSMNDTLASASGKGNVSDWNCQSNITVAQFKDEIKDRFNITVKVATCDDWVLALDDLTLEQVGQVKTGAVKADMEVLLHSRPAAQPVSHPTPAPQPAPQPAATVVPNVVDNKTFGKVRVYGKAQNRTVLGIVNAYLVMYPHASLDDLNKAFPGTLNSSGRCETLFVDVKDKARFGEHYELFFFEQADELITLSNGQQVVMQELWVREDFEKIVAWAKQYEIVVADFKPREGFRKGGYTLEYLNGYVPPKPGNPKRWLWIGLGALALILILLIALLARRPETKVVEKIVIDTVYIQQIQEIEAEFNAVQFDKAKYDLKEEAKFILHDLANLMKKHPEIRISIEGHTSAEGDYDFNQKLSENRAKAAVNFLLESGVSKDRLQYKGYGSSKLKNTDDPFAPENRRTEFIPQ